MHRAAFMYQIGQFENNHEVDWDLKRLQYINNLEQIMMRQLFINNGSTSGNGNVFCEAREAGEGEEDADGVDTGVVAAGVGAVECKEGAEEIEEGDD